MKKIVLCISLLFLFYKPVYGIDILGWPVNSKYNTSTPQLVLNMKLLQAAREGDLEKVKESIKEGAQVDTDVEYDARTPLIEAGSKGYKEICEFLLSKGANPNIQDGSGQTVLMQSNEEICAVLLNGMYTTNINAQDNNGWTALMFAVKKDDKKLCELFIANNADASITTIKEKKISTGGGMGPVITIPQEFTALKIAEAFKNEEIVELLKKATTPSQPATSSALINPLHTMSQSLLQLQNILMQTTKK